MQRADYLKRPWCWERLRAGGEGDDREWDGWMESLTRWTLVWVDSGSWWWTGRPGCCGSWGRRVRHDWVTEMNWTEVSVSFQFLMQKKEEEERVLRWKMLKTIRRQHEWPSPLGFRQSPMNSKGSANHCVYQISLQGRITGGAFTLMPVSHTGHRSESPRGRSYCVYRCIFHAPGDFILPQRLRLSARRPDDQILPTFSLSQPDFPRLSGLSS